MPTLKQLRLEARLSVSQLARLANLDRGTVERAESGHAVQEVKAYAILSTLNNQLGQRYTLDQITGLNIL